MSSWPARETTPLQAVARQLADEARYVGTADDPVESLSRLIQPLQIAALIADSRGRFVAVNAAAAYKPTFVRSMAMVPIGGPEPIGAIGVYWAEPHQATESEMEIVSALADSVWLELRN